MDIDDEDVFKELNKMTLGFKDGKLGTVKDRAGLEIEDILPSQDEAHLYREDADGSFDNSMAELLP